MSLPVLYTFRRCPYAMRARMAIAAAGVVVEQREVVLRDKPAAMLAISPKGTVPVLSLPDGEVIQESLEIMQWALAKADPLQLSEIETEQTAALIANNDGDFKYWLDRYKYAARFPEETEAYYRDKGCLSLAVLERLLRDSGGAALLGDQDSLADYALFPFVRQFARVDEAWFLSAPFPHLLAWYQRWLSNPAFTEVMRKYPKWEAGQDAIVSF
ncbi:MAG: glutathione S-transferase [Pseudoalteromonas tetraodonis]|jgi:glutathione S-transferase